MQWVKENAPQYFSPWQKMQHPSFGEVEIGGFNYKFTHQNPPEHLLVKTCEDDARFNLRFAFAMPRLEIASVEKEKIAKDIYKITAVVGNTGYLPTNLSDEAVKLGVNKPAKAYFERSFAQIPGFDPEKTLIVGDSLSSDILGGQNAGIATCWVNPAGKECTLPTPPDYQIESLSQLTALLKKL